MLPMPQYSGRGGVAWQGTQEPPAETAERLKNANNSSSRLRPSPPPAQGSRPPAALEED